MRFQLITLCAALLATAATAIPVPAASFSKTAIVNFKTLNGVDCILSLKSFGEFTGRSDRIGAYHADTNSCSIEDPTTPVFAGSANHKVPIMYFGAPIGRAGAGTITVEITYDNVFHGTIDPNIVGADQSVAVTRGFPPGYGQTGAFADGIGK